VAALRYSARDFQRSAHGLPAAESDEDARLPAPNRDGQGADVFTGVFNGPGAGKDFSTERIATAIYASCFLNKLSHAVLLRLFNAGRPSRRSAVEPVDWL